MNRFNLNLVLMVSLACFGISTASAHDKKGTVSSAAGATDSYSIGCDTGFVTLQVRINDVLPVKPPRLRITVEKDGQVASAIDSTDGDGKYSNPVTVTWGAGQYSVKVEKLAKGDKGASASVKTKKYPEIYNMSYHCFNAQNEHTEESTSLSIILNQ